MKGWGVQCRISPYEWPSATANSDGLHRAVPLWTDSRWRTHALLLWVSFPSPGQTSSLLTLCSDVMTLSSCVCVFSQVRRVCPSTALSGSSVTLASFLQSSLWISWSRSTHSSTRYRQRYTAKHNHCIRQQMCRFSSKTEKQNWVIFMYRFTFVNGSIIRSCLPQCDTHLSLMDY